MTTSVLSMAGQPPTSRRREILDWYDKLPRRSFSEILGVAPHADSQAARMAFRALVKRFHPDALGPAEADLRDKAQTVLMRITDAYEAILADATATENQHPVALRPPPALPPSPEEARPFLEAPAQPAQPHATVEPRARRQRIQEAIEEAEAYMYRREFAAAVDTLHEVVRLADGDQRSKVRLLLAAAYVADPKRRRNALALLNEILGEEPSNAEALTLLGTLYLREGLLARAESTLARAVAADPGHQQARAKLLAVRETVRERSTSKGRQTHGAGLFARLLSIAR
jgi:tetratricopeptide (TPR) repeat protein